MESHCALRGDSVLSHVLVQFPTKYIVNYPKPNYTILPSNHFIVSLGEEE